MAEGLKKERLVCERDGAINRVRVLESEVGDARRRIGERDERCVFDFPIACFFVLSALGRANDDFRA